MNVALSFLLGFASIQYTYANPSGFIPAPRVTVMPGIGVVTPTILYVGKTSLANQLLTYMDRNGFMINENIIKFTCYSGLNNKRDFHTFRSGKSRSSYMQSVIQAICSVGSTTLPLNYHYSSNKHFGFSYQVGGRKFIVSI